MEKNRFNIFLFILLIALTVSSCESLFKKDNEGEIKIVIADSPIFSSFYSFSSNELKSGITESGIAFKVVNRYSDTLNYDTLTYIREDFDFFDRDTIYIDREYYLTLDEEITLRQLEDYLRTNNYSYRNLREKVYWMSRISRAKIKENKNNFGDVEGCWLVTPESEYIPPDYWSYSLNTLKFLDQKYDIFSKRCVIAQKSAKYSSIEFLLFTPSLNIVDFDPYYNYKIKLNTNQEGSKYKTRKGQELAILVQVRSRIAINRWTGYSFYTDYSPFKIIKLKEAQFPREK
ncbi:MAG: hypothetical protein RBQ97_08635 [Acholeplasma sp.]|nr:hypothetical protein [Acholeplasma sp.]